MEFTSLGELSFIPNGYESIGVTEDELPMPMSFTIFKITSVLNPMGI